MSTNAGYEYFAAEKKYLAAQTMEQRIFFLEEMIKFCPKHKGSENMLAELKTRLKKLVEKKEKSKSVGKTTKKGIKKEGYQLVLLGLTNSGKSTLLSKLTNAKPKINPYPFTTNYPEIGTLNYQGIKAQIVDLPAAGSDFFDIGIINTADCVIIVVENLEDIEKLKEYTKKSIGTSFIVLTKADKYDSNDIRKLEATIRSKKIDGLLISAESDYNLDQLREKIREKMKVIRVYTKEPGRKKAELPVVLKEGSTVKDVAESILKGFSQRVKETRLTGPSSKFSNQKVGLAHILKDLDIVEFHTI